jgi:hypothetical protein
VRFLASIWQEKMQANFGIAPSVNSKEMGQLKTLRLHLGDLTQELIEWIVEPVNWWHFCQQVRAESKNHMITERPDIGLLLLRRGSALRAMRSKLIICATDAEFVKKLEQAQYDQIKALLLAAYVEGKPERLAKIEAAKTLTDMQRVFIEMTD